MRLIIDGKRIEADGGKTILDVARENDIPIPALCDHPILKPFGGCRLCIVEIQGRRGFAPSCSTYIEDGMVVKSDSPQLRRMRKEILGLILSEHPDACLVCTEKESCDEYKSTIRKVGEVTGCVLCSNNGRCDLQDVVEAVQVDRVDFPSVYRNYEVKKNDPFFDRNYNLCILCGRCVRVCHELRGASTVHFVNRGSDAVIGTVLDRPLHESGCQFCGACVDVCPTGALTERAIKYEPLPDGSAITLCPLCGMGCELEVMLKGDRMLNARPSEKGAVNWGQACVKGRFLVKDVVYSPRRIVQPMIRRKKELEAVSWEDALDFVAQKIKTHKGSEVGLITSPQLSCEDYFVGEKFARKVLKTKNVAVATGPTPLDSLLSLSQKNGMKPSFNFKKEEISQSEIIFLAGTDLAVSHPLLWLEVLKAVRKGAKLVVASPYELVGNRHAALWLQVKPGSEDQLFLYLSKVFLREKNVGGKNLEGYESFKKTVTKLKLSKVAEDTGVDEHILFQAAELLMQGKPCFISGMGLTQSPLENRQMAALWNLALLCKGRLIPLGLENNYRGAFELNRNGSGKIKNISQIIQETREGQIRALYLVGSAPIDIKEKPDFLVVQDSHMSEIAERADAVFPATTFAETEGLVVNVEGRVQMGGRVIQPLGDAKPDWWILSRLATKLRHKDFDYKKPQDVLRELKKSVPMFAKISTAGLKKGKTQFVGEGLKGKVKYLSLKSRDKAPNVEKKFPFTLWADYNLDSYKSLVLSREIRGFEIVRNSRWIRLNPEDAKSHKCNEGEIIFVESPAGKFKGVVKISEAVPKGTVGASFLWSEEPDFSLARLVSSQEEGFRFPFPVRIRRGK